jgi:uncharacterized hydrophobic protein (TIGR00271 family)
MTGDDRFNTTQSMRDAVFFDGPEASRRYSRFWLLLILSAVIASAGVVADSTATVIGAMIVAPLMTPILGTMLATVLGDHANLVRSLLLVLAGAAAAIAIGYLVGTLVTVDVLADNNPQVAGRVTPGLIDLLAALGTGVVGSIALIRRDISDTLPGVAIAISLVPPLAVVGLTLEAGSIIQALGALLLFLTNFVAIIGTGIVVMSVYGVNRLARVDTAGKPRRLARPIVLLAIMLVIIGAPLAYTSLTAASRAIAEGAVLGTSEEWAQSVGWEVQDVSSEGSKVVIRIEGPLPLPDTKELKTQLEAAGVDTSLVLVNLVPIYTVDLGDGP